MNNRISKLLALAIPALFLPIAMNAQSRQDAVGVGVRVPTEDLHVKGRVRVGTLPKTGTASSVYTKPDGTLSAGGRDQTFDADAHRVLFANEQGVVGHAMATKPLFFHMPCVVLPLENTSEYYKAATGFFEMNLYQRYVEQFTNPTGTPVAGSPAATRAVSPSAGALPVEQAVDLEYYITYYDSKVFKDVSIDNNGVLRYKVIAGSEATEYTFMDVIFKLK